jgi:hypothetical protein
VQLALLRVGEHLVGLGDLLEALLLLGVHVGVQLARQPAERPLDLVRGRVASDAEQLVETVVGQLALREALR